MTLPLIPTFAAYYPHGLLNNAVSLKSLGALLKIRP